MKLDGRRQPNNSFNRSANSAALIEKLDGFGGSSRPVNSGVRFLLRDNVMKIPTGLDHLETLAVMGAMTQRQSTKRYKELETERIMIGTALSALYQAATCHRKCHGGAHVLEALCGRMYNLAAAAYTLMIRGYYDEALNLIRSIGEVSNLIALSVVDKGALREWLSSDKQTRLRKFSPGKVRKALEQQESDLLLANDDWYSRFCEMYTHVTPQTKPNMHNETDKGFVGGVYQSDGLNKAFGELATILGVVSLLICKYFGFEDLFKEIGEIIDAIDEQSTTNGI